MAVHFDGVDGNHAVCLGGVFNASDTTSSWTGSFAGATALSVAFTVQCDSLTPGNITARRRLVHQNSSFKYWVDGSTRALTGFVQDVNTNARSFTTAAGTLTAGVIQRVLIRWSAALNVFKVQVNDTDVPVSLGGVTISALHPGPWAVNQPLELGASSADDEVCPPGTYQQWAIWSTYLSDADAALYGATGLPYLLSQTGVYYVDLSTPTPIDLPGGGQSGAYAVGHLVDNWTGVHYGATTWTYNYGSGDFQWPYNGAFGLGAGGGGTVVADLATGGSATPPPPWYTDPTLPLLPQRGIEAWEQTGQLGRRNNVLHVPADFATIQAAMNAATYGDDIVVDHTQSFTLTSALIPPAPPTVTATTLREPPRGRTRITGRTPITGATALTGSTAVTAVAGGPAYIRVLSDDLASLPQITPRAVDLQDGTTTFVYDAADGGSCGVLAAHTAHMPTLNCTGGQFLGIGINVAPHKARYWYFHGLNAQFPTGTGLAIDLEGYLGSNAGAVAVGYQYGPDPTAPDHIIVNQCNFDADPTAVGYGGGKWAWTEGDYLAFLNNRVVNFYAQGGGENNLTQTMGDSWGPVHYENNDLPLVLTQSWFSGGGATNRVGVQMQDNVWRRNWQYCPGTWRQSEINPVNTAITGGATSTTGGWVVSFTASDALTVHYVSGHSGTDDGGFPGPANGWSFGAGVGGIMYELATGKARRIATANESPLSGSTPQTMVLDTAWPGAGGGTPLQIGPVYFQRPSPNVLYNSGMDDVNHGGVMPTATFTQGSTTVTFSVALPSQCQIGHFIYPNNHWWDGGWGASDSAPPVPGNIGTHDTSYGRYNGVTYANCKRKKIVAIASDRLSCTLENPFLGSTGDGNPLTFPFSVVLFDGLTRHASTAGKGAWETKCSGSRMLMEGNVEEYTLGSGSLHNVQNPGNYDFGNPITVTAGTLQGFDTATGTVPIFTSGSIGAAIGLRGTFNPRGWPRGSEPSYPYPVLVSQPFFATDFWSQGRVIWRALSDVSCTLEPTLGLAANATFQPPATFTERVGLAFSPWWTVQGFTRRYNLIIGSSNGTSNMVAVNEESGEMLKGKWSNHSHNVYLLHGSPATAASMAVCALNMPTDGSGAGASVNGYGTYTTCQGETSQDNSSIRFSKNTMVRVRNQPGQRSAFLNIGPGGTAAKVHDLDVSDNLVGLIGSGTSNILANQNGAAVDPLGVLTMDASVRIARNVFGGPQAPTVVAGTPTFTTNFPDNAGVVDETKIGFANYTGTDDDVTLGIVLGTTDPTDLTPYALTDIYSTGTVSLSADGLTVTLDSGAFPSTVVGNQFIRIGSTGLGKFAPVVLGLDPKWATYPQWALWQIINNAIFPTQLSNFNVMTYGFTLNNDQWAEADVPGGNPPASTGVGLALRFATPPSRNGYTAQFTGNAIYFHRWDAGAFTQLGGPTAYVLPAASRARFEVSGTVLTVSVGGVTKATYDTAGDATKYGGGLAGVYGAPFSGSLTAFSLDNFTAGNLSAPSTPVISDSFTPAAVTRLTLTAPYSDHARWNTSGNAFAVTFKGSATDGTDPGANLSVVQQLVRNVRRHPV